MSDDAYIVAAYALTWLVLLPFASSTLRRMRRAERAARALGGRSDDR